MTNKTKNNNKWNYLIDLTFTKVNRLFVLPFENENDRTSFSVSIMYYVTNVLWTKCSNKRLCVNLWKFFDTPIKIDKKTYKQITETGRNNDYTTGSLLDYEYFSKHYKLIAIDLSKQIELENPHLKQQISFIGSLKEIEEQ